MRDLTIVMYHYVRPVANSKYPRLKGLELDAFKRQLDFLESRYRVVTAEDIVSAARTNAPLPAGACWLTFDDGYRDHHAHVLPELLKRGIQGSFFAPAKPVAERMMLDVNSIHFILASTTEPSIIVRELNELCRDAGLSGEQLKSLWSTHAVGSRYDPAEVIYVKRMLQHALPERIRHDITSILFETFVGVPQRTFADELYMSKDEIRHLTQAGMYVGSHGYRHLWMNKEEKHVQASEIKMSIDFLKEVGAPVDNWIMCYPYGAYNEDTITLLEDALCAVGVTSEPAKADLDSHHRLKLPRLDTNDFPQ